MMFGENLKSILIKKGMNQRELANEMKKEPSAISGWIKGTAFPSVTDLIKLCNFFKCSSDWLLGLGNINGKEYEHKGIKWVEQNLDDVNESQKRVIEIGIQLFKALIVDNLNAEAVNARSGPLQNYDFGFLRYAFKVAVRSGYLRVTAVPRAFEKEEQILDKFKEFKLKDIIIADIQDKSDGTVIRAEFVAFLAATHALNKLTAPTAVGLGPGYTILRMTELSMPDVLQFRGTKWIPLITFASRNLHSHDANYIALSMANRQPGSEALYLPYMSNEASKKDQNQAEKVRSYWRNMNAAFFSVNGPNRKSRARLASDRSEFRTSDFEIDSPQLREIYNELLKTNEVDKCAGELLGRMINLDGKQMMDDNKYNHVYGIDLDTLGKDAAFFGLSWLVAARQYKAKAVLASLKSGLANALVIDNDIADYLLSINSP